MSEDDAWKAFQEAHGNPLVLFDDDLDAGTGRAPKRLQKGRHRHGTTGPNVVSAHSPRWQQSAPGSIAVKSPRPKRQRGPHGVQEGTERGSYDKRPLPGRAELTRYLRDRAQAELEALIEVYREQPEMRPALEPAIRWTYRHLSHLPQKLAALEQAKRSVADLAEAA